MLDKIEIQRIIDKITSGEDYEGDYGCRVNNVSGVLNYVDEVVREDVPQDYLEFLCYFGFGELDPAFCMEDRPIIYLSIYGREIKGFEGMYVFASNSGEFLYAFDSRNNWTVVGLSSESDECEFVAKDFSGFIVSKLKYLEDIVDWRAEN